MGNGERSLEQELAAGTLDGFEGTGEGHWLDNASADTLRAMVRLAVERKRGAVEAGDALADAVTDIMADDPESVLHTWVRRWRDAAHPGGQ